MGKRPYPPEFRQQMVELVRAGCSPEKLAEEIEPSAILVAFLWQVCARLRPSEHRNLLTLLVFRGRIRTLNPPVRGSIPRALTMIPRG